MAQRQDSRWIYYVNINDDGGIRYLTIAEQVIPKLWENQVSRLDFLSRGSASMVTKKRGKSFRLFEIGNTAFSLVSQVDAYLLWKGSEDSIYATREILMETGENTFVKILLVFLPLNDAERTRGFCKTRWIFHLVYSASRFHYADFKFPDVAVKKSCKNFLYRNYEWWLEARRLDI